MHGTMKNHDKLDSTVPFSFSDGSRWYAVMTNIRCEVRAFGGLMAKGFRAFLPTEKRWVHHARVKRVVDRPLLSRYLFVETDPNTQGFLDIRLTDGVESLVCNNGVPIAMPKGLVEEFMRRQLSGEFDRIANEPLTMGTRVCIMDGQYEDFFATIVGDGKKRGGELLVQLLNSRLRTNLSRFSVRPA